MKGEVEKSIRKMANYSIDFDYRFDLIADDGLILNDVSTYIYFLYEAYKIKMLRFKCN